MSGGEASDASPSSGSHSHWGSSQFRGMGFDVKKERERMSSLSQSQTFPSVLSPSSEMDRTNSIGTTSTSMPLGVPSEPTYEDYLNVLKCTLATERQSNYDKLVEEARNRPVGLGPKPPISVMGQRKKFALQM